MELGEAVRHRRMVRSFDGRPVDPAALERLLDTARRGPSAGFVQAVDLLVLEGPEATGRFWGATLPPDRREGFPWPGLLRAPVVVVPWTSRAAYEARYAEPDKAGGAGAGWAERSPRRWAVPYWHVDAGFAVMLLLLAAVDEGLGAGFFAVPADRVTALRHAFAVPDDREPVGAVALGHPHDDDRPSSSARRRARRPLDDVVHRNHW